jgi:AbrB family looped-hinge helix DNA binding protein
MKEHLGIMTRKGQVTVPAEIRRKLGFRQGDRVSFRLEDNQVLLRRSDNVVEATKGIFKQYVDRPRTAEELRALAEEAIAEDVRDRSR